MQRLFVPLLFLALASVFVPAARAGQAAVTPAAAPAAMAPLTPYQPRHGRTRPVIAVIGHNTATEVTDYMVPFGILSESGAADVFALALDDRPLQFRPALTVKPQASIATFDRRFPEGADYVIVPAVGEEQTRDAALLGWLRAQARKGATIVSICDGALVVAAAGLFDHRTATGHWASQSAREAGFPTTRWLKNVRYVQDGNVISSAGVSAAIPLSIALVEAIAGRTRAGQLAARMGVDNWSAAHDSSPFAITLDMATTYVANKWLKPHHDLIVAPEDGMDDVALALMVDAWSSTNRSRAYVATASGKELRTRHGLVVMPDRAAEETVAESRQLKLDDVPPTRMLGRALDDIAARYGSSTARLVAAHFEYRYP